MSDTKRAVVAVRGTLTDDDCLFTPGPPREKAKRMLEKLKKDGYFVLIADPLANNFKSLRELTFWLNVNELPYDDIWVESGIPRADLYVNGLSRKDY